MNIEVDVKHLVETYETRWMAEIKNSAMLEAAHKGALALVEELRAKITELEKKIENMVSPPSDPPAV